MSRRFTFSPEKDKNKYKVKSGMLEIMSVSIEVLLA